MRVQFFAFCQDAEKKPNSNYTLHGVGGEMNIEGVYTGPKPPPLVPITIILAVGFVEGNPGNHRSWLVVERPQGGPVKTTDEASFDWPQNSPTHQMLYTLDMKIEPRTGIWEFHIFVDNEPLGVALLPLKFHIHKGD